ncbi:MAG: glycerol uptake facilitator protein [Gaiellaceae bacterium]|nr:glycerol uptake facilitator protein [Gaiellaceae bacterium]
MDEHSIGQRAIAEAIGTGLLVFIGAGSVPAIILLESGSKAPFSGADLGFIAVAFGLIVTAMIYTIGKVSGCHINPAVTFALALTKRFPWRELPTYWAAQVAGAIAGAFAIWASFGSRATDLGYGFGVVNFDHSVTSWGSAMFIEALGTAILMFTVLGIVDTRSPEGWAGLIIGLVVIAIIITVGPVTNASINPARQLGPLFVQTIHGSDAHNWIKAFGAYIPANLIGAGLAAFVYDLVATPRIVKRPIQKSVTEPDRALAEDDLTPSTY